MKTTIEILACDVCGRDERDMDGPFYSYAPENSKKKDYCYEKCADDDTFTKHDKEIAQINRGK